MGKAAVGLSVLILAASALWTSAGLAAPAALAQADRQQLIQGLEAQYEVALIRERKLADDREIQLIGALEARLKQARADAEAAKGDAQAANAQLASARSDLAKVAAQVSQRDPSAQTDIAAYASQAQTVADQASPELAAALQRFADGDRAGAWPTIQALTVAKDAKAPDAARAADTRQLAGLRDIMRAHGEATTADVLALHDAAASLDPSSFQTHVARAKLAHELGDLKRARAAAEQARTVAVGDGQRGLALRLIGEQAADQHDNQVAASDFDQALAIFQQLASTDPTDRNQSNLAAVLQDKGDLQVALGDYTGARTSYNAGLAIRQQLAAASPSDPTVQDYLTNDLQRIGDLDLKMGDFAGAQSAWKQGLDIRQKLSAADPTNTDLQFFVAGLMRRMGELAYKQGDFKGAQTQFEQCMTIHQRLAQANPSSAHIQQALAGDYFELANVALAQSDVPGAVSFFQKSLAIRKKLADADATNAEMQHYVLLTMMRLARLPGGGVAWPQVATEYAALKKAGQLTSDDDRVLTALKDHGAAAGL